MPSFIVKAKPDEDFYVYWSTIVDCPVAWGTRAELSGHLSPDEAKDERWERADKNGTSAKLPDVPDSEQWFGWNDLEFGIRECIPYRDGGWYDLPRHNLRELCERLDAEQDAIDLLVFTPDEDEPV
jgi:hypothetical protein